MTLEEICETYTFGSLGFCIAVETHCGFDMHRDQVAEAAARAASVFSDVSRAEASDLAEAFEAAWQEADR